MLQRLLSKNLGIPATLFHGVPNNVKAPMIPTEVLPGGYEIRGGWTKDNADTYSAYFGKSYEPYPLILKNGQQVMTGGDGMISLSYYKDKACEEILRKNSQGTVRSSCLIDAVEVACLIKDVGKNKYYYISDNSSCVTVSFYDERLSEEDISQIVNALRHSK